MNGPVFEHHALLNIPFRLPHQPDIEIEFAIDTGFIGYLTLPLAAIQALHLPFIRRMPANLADDSTIMGSVHAAHILWRGEEREIEVLATGKRPLLGTLLLHDHQLNVQFADGGLVTIDSL
jgi:clan AA aspartic protease